VKVKPIAMRNGFLIINRRDEIKDKDESHSLKRFLTRVFCGGQGASRERGGFSKEISASPPELTSDIRYR